MTLVQGAGGPRAEREALGLPADWLSKFGEALEEIADGASATHARIQGRGDVPARDSLAKWCLERMFGQAA